MESLLVSIRRTELFASLRYLKAHGRIQIRMKCSKMSPSRLLLHKTIPFLRWLRNMWRKYMLMSLIFLYRLCFFSFCYYFRGTQDLFSQIGISQVLVQAFGNLLGSSIRVVSWVYLFYLREDGRVSWLIFWNRREERSVTACGFLFYIFYLLCCLLVFVTIGVGRIVYWVLFTLILVYCVGRDFSWFSFVEVIFVVFYFCELLWDNFFCRRFCFRIESRPCWCYFVLYFSLIWEVCL